ncbi:ABC transporter ATP-binding protein [Corynebacterium sp. H127]
MNRVIEVQQLKVNFGQTEVLRGVDLEFHRGQIYGLLGPNGAGKTTILKAILGAVDYTGSIKSQPEHVRIGHLIEYPAFYARLSMFENLKLHANYHNAPHDELDDLLSLVGLSPHRDLPCGKASLGMKQRLGIARALIGDPHILLLDEPTNGLDPLGIRDCRELLIRLRDERNLAVVASSHNLTEISATANYLTFIRSGEIIHSLPRSEISEQGLEDLYVELFQGENS